MATDPRSLRPVDVVRLMNMTPLFADHLTAEYRVPTEGRGRKVDEWKQRPGQDNHFFDCLVGCAVAASMQGAALENIAVPYKPRKRVSLAEMQQEAFRRQGLR